MDRPGVSGTANVIDILRADVTLQHHERSTLDAPISGTVDDDHNVHRRILTQTEMLTKL